MATVDIIILVSGGGLLLLGGFCYLIISMHFKDLDRRNQAILSQAISHFNASSDETMNIFTRQGNEIMQSLQSQCKALTQRVQLLEKEVSRLSIRAGDMEGEYRDAMENTEQLLETRVHFMTDVCRRIALSVKKRELERRHLLEEVLELQESVKGSDMKGSDVPVVQQELRRLEEMLKLSLEREDVDKETLKDSVNRLMKDLQEQGVSEERIEDAIDQLMGGAHEILKRHAG